MTQEAQTNFSRHTIFFYDDFSTLGKTVVLDVVQHGSFGMILAVRFDDNSFGAFNLVDFNFLMFRVIKLFSG